MATQSSILPGKFHGQRSLVGYNSWGCKESDTTEHAHTLQTPIPGFIVAILSRPGSLHSRHHPPSLRSCAALGKKFPLHSRCHSTSITPKGDFIILTTAEKTGSSAVITPKVLADMRLLLRADWPQGWCSLFYFILF